MTLGVCTAQAQRISSPYRFLDTSQEAGLYVGHVKAGEGSAQLGHKSGNSVGLRYALRFSSAISVDADVMYFRSEIPVRDTTVSVTAGDSSYTQLGTAKSNLLVPTVSLRLNLTGLRTWNNILPYLTFGGGGAFEVQKDKPSIERAPVDARYALGTSFAGTFGAGIQIFPTDRLALRIDGRNVLWKVKTPAALLRGRISSTIPKDEWVSNLAFSAGLSFHF
ncbi:MAG TPA: outer membrane beta-barrel protein [Longimicrobiales bacterium]|nr:outer membrane beta-barrel protein [Longimicrobiales bacterium]